MLMAEVAMIDFPNFPVDKPVDRIGAQLLGESMSAEKIDPAACVNGCPEPNLGADWRADMSGQMRHVVTQMLMDLADGYAENRHVRGAPEYNETTALSRKVLLEAIDKVVLTAAPAVVVSAEPVAASEVDPTPAKYFEVMRNLPNLPEVGYMGDDASYGYDAYDMRTYAVEAVLAALASTEIKK